MPVQTSKILRLILLPVGLFIKLYELAVTGSRDISNKLRFKNSIIDRNCCINPASTIDDNCHILENSHVLNSSIKRYSYIGRNSMIQNVNIGSFCSVANDVCIGLGTHPSNLFSTSPLFYRVNNTFKVRLIDVDYNFNEYNPIEIGHDVWIGARAMIMDGIKVGDGAIIAANAVVTKDIPPYAIVAGVPARIIRYRFSSEKIENLLQSQWWLLPLSEIKERMNDLNDASPSIS